jgi:hypothetical protein
MDKIIIQSLQKRFENEGSSRLAVMIADGEEKKQRKKVGSKYESNYVSNLVSE